MPKNVLITGVSSGIGFDAAGYLISKGFHVYGTVRNNDQVQVLQEKLGSGFTALVCDVSNANSVSAMAGQLSAMLGEGTLTGLVNNAGISVSGPLLHVPLDEMKRQYEVNVFGALRVIQAVAGLLGAHKNARKRGRIVNIGSVSGRISFPMVGPYCSSKHALVSLTECLRRELAVYDIPVILVEPGNVKTDIWQKLEQKSPYSETDYGNIHQQMLDALRVNGYKHGVEAVEISKAIFHALSSSKPKYSYLMPGASFRAIWQTFWKRKLTHPALLEKKLSLSKKSI